MSTAQLDNEMSLRMMMMSLNSGAIPGIPGHKFVLQWNISIKYLEDGAQESRLKVARWWSLQNRQCH